jgi:DNA-binding HxlR family transcriptional regulator
MFIDSFSGSVVELKRDKREPADILKCLKKDPMVSTWDMSETPWLRKRIAILIKDGLVSEKKQSFPWHRYELTEKGLAELAA